MKSMQRFLVRFLMHQVELKMDLSKLLAVKGNGSFTIVSRQKSNELQLLNNVGLSVVCNTTLSGTLNGHTIPGGSGTLALTSDITSSDVSIDRHSQLGGDLDVNGNAIVSASNGNIAITPNGSGKVIIDGLSHPVADGNAGLMKFLKTDGSGNLSFASVGSLMVLVFRMYLMILQYNLEET